MNFFVIIIHRRTINIYRIQFTQISVGGIKTALILKHYPQTSSFTDILYYNCQKSQLYK